MVVVRERGGGQVEVRGRRLCLRRSDTHSPSTPPDPRHNAEVVIMPGSSGYSRSAASYGQVASAHAVENFQVRSSAQAPQPRRSYLVVDCRTAAQRAASLTSASSPSPPIHFPDRVSHFTAASASSSRRSWRNSAAACKREMWVPMCAFACTCRRRWLLEAERGADVRYPPGSTQMEPPKQTGPLALWCMQTGATGALALRSVPCSTCLRGGV